MAEARARRSTTEARQYWQGHSDGYSRSGLTREAYCKQHNLNVQTFAYWRHRLKTDSEPIKLVQLPTPVSQPTAALRLEVNGYSVEVSDGFSSAALARLVCVLQEL
jgi:hypothetical protein